MLDNKHNLAVVSALDDFFNGYALLQKLLAPAFGAELHELNLAIIRLDAAIQNKRLVEGSA